jgi:hypothetical protein
LLLGQRRFVFVPQIAADLPADNVAVDRSAGHEVRHSGVASD